MSIQHFVQFTCVFVILVFCDMLEYIHFASPRPWWIAALLGHVDEQLLVQFWHLQFLSFQKDPLTVRLLYLIVPNVVSTLLEIVDILRIDFDDNFLHPGLPVYI